MIRKLKHILFLFLLCFQSSLFAQQVNYEQGTLLVQLTQETNIKSFVHQWTIYNNKPTKLSIQKQLVRQLNMWQLSFNFATINEKDFLAAIKKDRLCVAAQFNHFVKNRQTIPNDALFSNQWHHINLGGSGGVVDADMDTDLAWDLSTGGLTFDGDTIVVAVLDDGIQVDHPDLAANLWRNSREIPNNGMDDDGNGYVDDYHGWNINTNTPNIAGGGHGMPVAGIIGAVGNNSIGVSGVNWRVKLMIVKNDFNTTEAAVLEAYAYPLAMRMKYNETDGAEGAFVVATNASWGVDYGDPDDAELWCGMFDQLGEEGILNCGATANINLDVDADGDLPTSCTSDYLIAVTNLKRNNVKETAAAYGATSVDLGAFGSSVFTLGNDNNYTTFGGTSGATPQVTGAIALLYSLPCPDIPLLYKSDPAAAALLMKTYILDGVDPNTSLNNITTTGGKLNINNSAQLALDNCSPCLPPYNLGVTNLTVSSATFFWTAPLDASSDALRWRVVGTSNWNISANVNSPFTIGGLLSCETYEFQVESTCGNTMSGFSNNFSFRTDGCCEAPLEIEVSEIGLNSCLANFDSVTAADSYTLAITNLISGSTSTINTIENAILIEQLESCTPYEIKVKSICSNGVNTSFNNGTTFITFGCGACSDFTYCSSQGQQSDFEWIANFSLNSLNNSSGNNDGYGDYTGLFTEVATYGTYEISLTPAFAGPSYNEYFKVWIDYNQNGVFEDATELVFDPLGTTSETITGEVIIPETALPGLTRMRVTMKYIGDSDMVEPEACTALFGFGEVEDYCLQIVAGSPPECDLPFNLNIIDSAFQSVTISWEDPTDDHENHNLRYRKAGTFNWTQIEGIDPPFTLSNLEFCVGYEAQVSANCVGTGTSGYTNIYSFTTGCIIDTDNPTTKELQLAISPNPASGFLHLDFELPEATSIRVSLIAMDGKRFSLIKDRFEQAGIHHLLLENLDRFPAGLYYLLLETEAAFVYEKVLLGR